MLHSATKFIGGHGTSIGGMIVDSGRFPWDRGTFPQMLEPSKGYHGIRFHETFGDFAYIMKARVEGLRDFGPALSPFNSFLFLQGLETLKLRMQCHTRNALAVAQFLAGIRSCMGKLSWSGFQPLSCAGAKISAEGSGRDHEFRHSRRTRGRAKVHRSLRLVSHLANVGDAKSLVIHPASTTHQQLSDEEKQMCGISDDMVRLSVGIEDLDDILWDLNQALTAASKA